MSILTMYTLIGALTVLFTWSSASAQNRFALLIGNQTYASAVGALKNPHQDIALIGQALRDVGFSVTSKQDLRRVEILQSVEAFAKLLGNDVNAVGFFYYSGHGVANPDSRENYLIPTDVKNLADSDVWYNSVPLDEILALLGRHAPKASHFVIFDACRTELRLPVKSAVKGFVQPPEKNGMFIAFSTSPNETASDVGEDSGPYAKELAEEIKRTPGQNHLYIFHNVKTRVYNATGFKQRPWDTSGLLTLVYFATGQQEPPVPPKPGQRPARTAQEISADNISRYIGKGDKDWWEWKVFVKATSQVLENIECVEYTLHSSFPDPVRKVCKLNDFNYPFAFEANGWGTFPIPIRVFMKDGRVQELTHTLKFSSRQPER